MSLHHQVKKERTKMKTLENMKALNEMELSKVAGGDNDTSILKVFLDSLIQLPTETPIKAPCKRGKC